MARQANSLPLVLRNIVDVGIAMVVSLVAMLVFYPVYLVVAFIQNRALSRSDRR